MFQFRLARVLDYRHLRQQGLERELRQKQHQLQREETRLAGLQADCQALEEQLSASQGTALLGEEVQRWRGYYQSLEPQITAQKATIAEVTRALAATRQALLEAQQETKILEKLSDKTHQEYIRKCTHREQQRLDEHVVTRSRYGY